MGYALSPSRGLGQEGCVGNYRADNPRGRQESLGLAGPTAGDSSRHWPGVPRRAVHLLVCRAGIELRYIQPGNRIKRPSSSTIIRTDRTEVLNASVFESVDQVREITTEWLQSYNEERPQDALAGLSPATYRARLETRSSPIEVAP